MSNLVAALLLLVGSALALTIAFVERAQSRMLAHRVDQIVHSTAADKRSGVRRIASVWRTRAEHALLAFFTFRMRRRWGIRSKPGLLLCIGMAAATAGWLLANMGFHLPVYVAASAALTAFFLLPRIVLIKQQRRSNTKFSELLPDAIDMVVRIVRAGLPVVAAIRTVGTEVSPPLNTVFARIADQTEIGLPLDQALERISDEVGNPDFRFFAVAVALQQSTGGNLTATLETLGQIIRKRRAVRMKARATTAEVKISAIVLGSVPFVVTAALLIVAPSYLDVLFLDPRGNFIVGLALLCLLLAGLTMRTMIRNTLST